MAIRGVSTVGNEGARFYWTLGSMFFSATGFGIAVFVGAFAMLIVRTRMLPRALGWFGLAWRTPKEASRDRAARRP